MLDELEIWIMDFIYMGLIVRLNALYERGFYQRLKVYLCLDDTDENTNDFAQLNGLVALHMVGLLNGSIQFSHLTGLKEIFIQGRNQVVDLPNLSNNLPNLERVEFLV